MCPRRSSLAAVILCASVARADDLPIQLSQQGYLLGADDQPVSNAASVLTFTLFDRLGPLDGAAVWGGAANGAVCTVPVANGYYAVTLGGGPAPGGCGTGLLASHVPATEARFVEIAVNGVALSPRLRIGTAPLAVQAADAARLGGHEPAYYLDAAHLTGVVPTGALPLATSAAAGALSAADKTKLDALTPGAYLTAITGTAPVTIDSTVATAPAISVSTATPSAKGLLSAVDKTKLDALVVATPVACAAGSFISEVRADGTFACTAGGTTPLDTDADGVPDTIDGDDDDDGYLDGVDTAPLVAAARCEGTKFGNVCRSYLGTGAVNWGEAVRFCQSKGRGNHLCSDAETMVIFDKGGLGSYPTGTDHFWVDGAEGNDNLEVPGYYTTGVIDDWPQNMSTGAAQCCQTHPKDVVTTCGGQNVGGVCRRDASTTAQTYRQSAQFCDDRGFKLCTLAEARALCGASQLPSLPGGADHFWLDAGEGNDNQEQTGLSSACVIDDWVSGTATGAAICCQQTKPWVALEKCPGTSFSNVCLAATVPYVTFAEYAPACYARGLRACRTGEGYLIARGGGLATSDTPYWIDGSEGSTNQNPSGLYSDGRVDEWTNAQKGTGLCCL